MNQHLDRGGVALLRRLKLPGERAQQFKMLSQFAGGHSRGFDGLQGGRGVLRLAGLPENVFGHGDQIFGASAQVLNATQELV